MTRSYKAGMKLGEAIIEMVHLMYQNTTAIYFYNALLKTLKQECKIRKIEIND